MSSKPWYAWYPSDYRAKTAHLSYLEDSAYRRMLDAYFERGGPLPSDRPSLFRICGAMTSEEQAAINTVADEFFFLNDNGLHNYRADQEIAKQQAIRAQLSEAGRLGGRLAGKGRPKPTPNGALGESTVHNHSTQATTTDHRLQNTKTKTPVRIEKPPELPDWLPLDAWRDWLAMRVRIRKPATARAQRMALGNLEQLREAGEDPNQVICKAINKCWLEFWPLERPK